MKYQSLFNRYEMKYILSLDEYEKLMSFLDGKVKDGEYKQSLIRNIYYDTPDFLLVRRSLDKPNYKEKLRVRCYGDKTADIEYFVELKKKYDSVVYKRRYAVHGAEMDVFNFPNTVTGREIEYAFKRYSPLEPKMYISYERLAYVLKENAEFRITFDTNVLWRTFGLSLNLGVGGIEVLPRKLILMELKSDGAIPLWLAEYFSQNGIYKTNFSKYGEAYKAFSANKRWLGGSASIKLKGDFGYARRFI